MDFLLQTSAGVTAPKKMVGPVPGAIPVGQPVTAWRPGSLEATWALYI